MGNVLMMIVRIYFLCLVALTLSWGTASAQLFPGAGGAHPYPMRPGANRLLSLDAASFASDDTGKSRLDISISIPQSFFVFVRGTAADASQRFRARAEVSLEVHDKDGASVGRKIFSEEMESDLPESPDHEHRFLRRMLTFTLPPGDYSLLCEVEDLESSRKHREEMSVVVRNFLKHGLRLSDPLFLTEGGEGHLPQSYLPLAPGTGLPFGENFSVYVEVLSKNTTDTVALTYELAKFGRDTTRVEAVHTGSVGSSAFLTGQRLATLFEETPRYSLTSAPEHGVIAVLIPIRGDTLDRGRYELTVLASSGNVIDTVRRKFNITWLSMPRSLRSMDLAAEMLEYIMTKEEFAALRDASGNERDDLFYTFWKSKDPTPGTSYNEAMAEYYRRVDYSLEHFSSFGERRGAKTDRGRAYILYGPPARSHRDLAPGKTPSEIWYYPNIGKKVVFTDTRGKGEYRLVAIEDLRTSQ